MKTLSLYQSISLLTVWLSCWLMDCGRAEFIQGQVPDGVFGQAQWDARRSFSGNGVAIDPVSGKLFISDTIGNRVLRYPASVATSQDAIITTPAEAVLGQPHFYSRDAGPLTTGLNQPQGLTFDSAGNLYVADTGNNRVVRFSGAANAASGAPIDWALGQASLTENAAGSGSAAFKQPEGIAIFGGYLGVADTGNHRVQVFHNFTALPTGSAASVSYGTGVAGLSDTTMNQPTGVAFSASGSVFLPGVRMWVADHANHRVLRFEGIEGTPIVDGVSYDKTADGVLGQANFTTDTRGNLPLATNLDAYSVLTNGTRLYVGDVIFSRVVRFDSAAAKANGAAASGVLGQINLTTNFTTPNIGFSQMAMGASGLWLNSISSSAGYRFNTPAVNTSTASSVLTGPTAGASVAIENMAEDQANGKFYLAQRASPSSDGIQVKRYRSAVDYRTGAAAEVTISLNGAVGFVPTMGKHVLGMAAQSGMLAMSDTDKHRVIVIRNAATTAGTVAAQTDIVGQPNSSSTSPGINDTGLTRMNYPTDLCFATTPAGAAAALFVTDTGNNRILRYPVTFPREADLFGVNFGPAGTSTSTLSQPRGVAYDPNSGSLYVADTGANRILRYFGLTDNGTTFNPPEPAVGVIGQINFTDSNPGTGLSHFNAPTHLALHSAQGGNLVRIYVADTGNHRIARFDRINVAIPGFSDNINLTFNTVSPNNDTIYSDPLRGFGNNSFPQLLVEQADSPSQGALWVGSDQRLSWFEYTYIPTITAVGDDSGSFFLKFTKRPFCAYQILSSADLTTPTDTWTVVAEGFYTNDSLTGYFADIRLNRPRQFYRIREVLP